MDFKIGDMVELINPQFDEEYPIPVFVGNRGKVERIFQDNEENPDPYDLIEISWDIDNPQYVWSVYRWELKLVVGN